MTDPSASIAASPDELFRELDAGLAAGASDWHFRAGEPCRMRVRGELGPPGAEAPDEARLQALARAALGLPGRVAPGTDAAFSHRGERFRLHAYTSGGALCLSLRHVAGRIRGLEELGVPAAFRDAALAGRSGLVLVTGPAGSGKSTTLAAAVDHLNRRRPALILTLEDPVEFRHRPARGVVRQLEKGVDFGDFPQALREALRADPDALLLGELRDAETIAAALTAAETGHLVLATLHCAAAPDAVRRIVDASPPERTAEVRGQLARTLAGVLAQQLVRPPRGDRVGAFELLLPTPAVRHLVASPEAGAAALANEIATGRAHGMVSMDQSLEDLWRRRAIDRTEALRCAADPAALGRRLADIR